MAQKLVVPLTFQIRQGGQVVRTESVAQDVIKVGRDQKSHLRIDDEGVARMHAVIEAKPDDVQIIDLGSGTRVNGQPVNKATLRGLLNFHKVGAFTTMAKANAALFKDEKAAAVLNQFAGYTGSNPYAAPATLNLIAYYELALGSFAARGGMHAITQALVELAKRQGVRFERDARADATKVKQPGKPTKNAPPKATYRKGSVAEKYGPLFEGMPAKSHHKEPSQSEIIQHIIQTLSATGEACDWSRTKPGRYIRAS